MRTSPTTKPRALTRPSQTVVVAVALALGACACASDDGGGGGPTGPREASLTINQGLVFSTGVVSGNASYLKSDLVLYKNQGGFDLKPGSSEPGSQMAMRVFGSGGVPTVFPDLAAVPSQKPSAADQFAYMKQVGTGWGAVVQHNVGDGFSKVWIKQAIASAGTVVLQWEALP